MGLEINVRKRMESIAYYNLHHPLYFFLWPQYSLSDLPKMYFSPSNYCINIIFPILLFAEPIITNCYDVKPSLMQNMTFIVDPSVHICPPVDTNLHQCPWLVYNIILCPPMHPPPTLIKFVKGVSDNVWDFSSTVPGAQ
jgi:hypothetical protein